MLKRLLLATIVFLSTCNLIGVAFANPIPWDPWNSFLNLGPMQYFLIITAEFCSLVVGTAILVYNDEIRCQKAAITMLIALITSYALGISVWTLGYRTGILVNNVANPSPLGTIVLLLPEFIGTIVGAIIIHATQKVKWKTALIAMTAAMLVSFLVGILLAYITFSLR